MAQTLESFNDVCRINHVRSVNESNLSPEGFYQIAKRMLDLQIDGNLAFRQKVSSTVQPSQKYGGGDLTLLTNGVRGANDFHVQWLGWEGTDTELTVDLGSEKQIHEAEVGSLSVPTSWILHPAEVECLISRDGVDFQSMGTRAVAPETPHQAVVQSFQFSWPAVPARYVKFKVKGTHVLPSWHSAAGGKSWFFLDELVVR